MFNKQRLKTMLILLVVACIAYSCSKETTENSNPQKNEAMNDEICKGTSPQYNDNNYTNHFTPLCITAMMQDSEFNDWNFSNMVHFHEFDTAGFYTYFIPPYYFYENNVLCVSVKDNEIALRYAMMFPDDFDYQTYYNQNRTAFVSIYSYDYEELFYEGYMNVRNRTFQFTYINPELLDDNKGLPSLLHWNDMNLCEKILTGVEIVWDAGFTIGTGGLGGLIATTANGFAFELMRRKAC